MLRITVRELSVQNTMRFHLTLVRMAVIQQSEAVNTGKNEEEKYSFHY